MEIVIDIPKEEYEEIINSEDCGLHRLTRAIAKGKLLTDIFNKIKAEIAEYKDDKVIHDERNEMIDIVLEIIDKYRKSEVPDAYSD